MCNLYKSQKVNTNPVHFNRDIIKSNQNFSVVHILHLDFVHAQQV